MHISQCNPSGNVLSYVNNPCLHPSQWEIHTELHKLKDYSLTLQEGASGMDIE